MPDGPGRGAQGAHQENTGRYVQIHIWDGLCKMCSYMAVCMDMGQHVWIWGSMYGYGAVCMDMGQYVWIWGSMYGYGAVCMDMGQCIILFYAALQ